MKLFINLFIVIATAITATSALAGKKNIETKRWGNIDRGRGGYEEIKRFPLQFHDQQYRGDNTLFLKRQIKQQYGNIALQQYEIVNIKLVAKTKFGRGSAHLKVGSWLSNPKRIYGNPQDFRSPSRNTYDKVTFNNNSYRTQKGPWQIKLQGNFKVKRVVVFLKEKNSHGGRELTEIIQCGQQGRRGRYAGGADSCDTKKTILKAQLIRDLSRRGNRCVKNYTWGFDRYGLWTEDGCVGSFKVTYQKRQRY